MKSDSRTTFRVMTYNIHHGEGLDGKVDLARIAALIKQERADIVALQEVDKGVARTARRDLTAELAARLDGHEVAIIEVLRRVMDILDPPRPPPEPETPKRRIGFHVEPEEKLGAKARKRA